MTEPAGQAGAGASRGGAPLLEARGLVKGFRVRGASGAARRLVAVDRVDLRVEAGELVALVGESGSGKTTLGRCLVRLIEPDAGALRFEGEDLLALAPRQLRRRRRGFQMVFQDPWESLPPRMRVASLLAEPLAVHRLVPRARRADRVAELLGLVGLGPDVAERYPHAFSGGQRQRLAIARALAVEPRLLVADEPISALDLSVQSQILNLLVELQGRLGLGVVLIAHDLVAVAQVAQRVVVMQEGRVVEEGPAAQVLSRPRHPYTVRLLESVPRPRRRPAGRPPRPAALPGASGGGQGLPNTERGEGRPGGGNP